MNKHDLKCLGLPTGDESYDTEYFQRVMRYKQTNTFAPTKHETLFDKYLLNVKAQLYREDCIHIGTIVKQKIFMFQEDAFIADFFLPLIRLVFEIDGKHHDSPRQKSYDSYRTKLINNRKIRVIRFKNEEIANLKTIQDKIKFAIKDRIRQLGNIKSLKLQQKRITGETTISEINDYIRRGGVITICPTIGKNKRNAKR